jgi:DNA-binding NarL/FixJ family response regulator
MDTEEVRGRVVRAVLIDDNREFLASAVRFLSAFPELDVVAAAVSAREAIDQIEVLQPDVVFMDIVMPEMDGLEATRLIKTSPASPKIIVWTLHVDPQYHAAALAAGADGFVAKSHLSKQLMPLISQIFEP